jgi:predicted cobalt transporter CbtA
MSFSTTGATSSTRPATSAAGFLRAALIAALAAVVVSAAFDLLVAERIVDRAIRAEAHVRTAMAMPEPFGRRAQRGGLVVGELVFGLGVALLLAGAATFASARWRPERLWLALTGACAWAVLVLPSVKYPPLPPGIATSAGLGERQTWYLVLVAAGLAGVAAAIWAWRLGTRVGAVGAVIAPAALAIGLLPDRGVFGRAPTDFRVASIATQALFWLVLAAVGALLLRRAPS